MRSEKEIEQAMKVCGIMAIKHCQVNSPEYNQFVVMASTMGWVLGKEGYSEGTETILNECYKVMREAIISMGKKL